MVYKVYLSLVAFFISLLMSLISGNILLTSLKRGLIAFVLIYIASSILAWIMKKEIEIYNYNEPEQVAEANSDNNSDNTEAEGKQKSEVKDLEAELGINIDELDLDNLDPEEMANILRTMSDKDES